MHNEEQQPPRGGWKNPQHALRVMPAYGEAQQQTPTAKHPTTEHPVGQEEVKTAVTASLHAFGINTQARECAKNARKRPAKAWLEVS